MDAAGRVIVVTGGARGIGRALATRFARERAQAVVVVDVDLDGASEVAEEIGGSAIHCDVSRESEVEQLIDRVRSTVVSTSSAPTPGSRSAVVRRLQQISGSESGM